MDFEYGIIGGGPAGYTVATMLAKSDNSVVLFEKDKLGGTCLNRGCIPTKSLLHSSEVYKLVTEASQYGLDVEIKSFDFSKIAEKRDKTVEKIRKSLELTMKNAGVKIVYAEAKIIDGNTILAEGSQYKVSKIINALGSKPRELKGLEFDGKFILNSDDLLKLEKLPKSVLIIGSGAIGIEWARIFSNFGTEVTIVELAEHLIPPADIEVSKRIERIFKQKNIKFYLKDSVEKIENKVVTLKSGVVIEPDFVLSAVGRVPLKTDYGINIGDSSGEIQLAHYAISQAHSLACGVEFRKDLVPSVIYGEPEIAWAGVREQDCDDNCQKFTLPVTALGKSWCDDATDGFIKLILRDKQIIGAHIVSKEASALIHEILIAMQYGITTDRLRKICFAHPTYSEGIFEIVCRADNLN